MILSTVTDEVTPDRSETAFEKIFSMATAAGIHNFELRMVEAKRFPVVDPAAWERLKRLAERYDIRFSAVSPGIFRAPLRSDLIPHHANEVLEMSLTLAERLGVRTLIIFGVQRAETDTASDFDRVVGLIRAVVGRAAERGFDVQLENMPGTWADTAANTLAILQAVDHPALGCVWDTGNFYEAEETHFAAGYELLRPYIRNVHLKDGRVVDGTMVWQRFGEGVTDVAGQLALLAAEGYDGTLTVEAKCEPHEDEDFIQSVAYLKERLAAIDAGPVAVGG
jgi:sugar phosphate isomerase/epimerase